MDKDQGLVAPVWSDSGDVPVGEVTYTEYTPSPNVTVLAYNGLGWEDVVARWASQQGSWPHVQDRSSPQRRTLPETPTPSPAMSDLSKVAGESYCGLGWCDQEGV